MHSLPIFVRLTGRAVILTGSGDAADAKRRLLERAGAVIVDEPARALLAVVSDGDEAVVQRLKARGVLVNAVDKPDLCDFTLPAIIDRSPVLIALGTGGASAGLAKVLRQRLEVLLPTTLGELARGLRTARAAMRERWPDGTMRRDALDAALAEGGVLDPLGSSGDVGRWLAGGGDPAPRRVTIIIRSPNPDDLTLREARWLGEAATIWHDADVPPAILARARADAARAVGSGASGGGLTVEVRCA